MKKSLLEVIDRKKNDNIPVWFMRQAGRYLPEFMEVRKKNKDFIKLCLTPPLVQEITLQPIKRFNLDAAILFSDILMVPLIMGYKVIFDENGPQVMPLDRQYVQQEYGDIQAKIGEAIRLIKAELEQKHPNVSLIGFAGAPWTVACYIVEGKLSRDCQGIRKLMYSDIRHIEALIDIIVENTIEYLKMQIEAGAEVIKIFDSWAGVLTKEYFERLVIRPTKVIVDNIRAAYPKVKIIGFPRGAGSLYYDYVYKTGIDVIALDQYVPLDWAKTHLNGVVLQGNMDNIFLAGASRQQVIHATEEIIEVMGDQGFIFNLGHGIIPSTPVENVAAVVEVIKAHGIRRNIAI